jgi:hypothetical protein
MGGCLSSIPSAQLGTIVVKEAIRRAGITPDQVEEVFMGNAIQAGGKPNVARQVCINSGIPIESPATTVNVLCGSGLHSINLAARMIRLGDRDIVAAGGCENMSAAPYLIQKGRYGYRMGAGTIEDSMIYDALNDAYFTALVAQKLDVEGGIRTYNDFRGEFLESSVIGDADAGDDGYVTIGEMLDDEVVTGAIHSIANANTLIVGGTSLVVYPAAGLLRYFQGKHLVVVNRTPTTADSQAELVFAEDIGKVFGDIKK